MAFPTFILYLNIMAMLFGFGCGIVDFKCRRLRGEGHAFPKSLGLGLLYMIASLFSVNAIRIVFGLMF
jgi:hypothetical protein